MAWTESEAKNSSIENWTTSARMRHMRVNWTITARIESEYVRTKQGTASRFIQDRHRTNGVHPKQHLEKATATQESRKPRGYARGDSPMISAFSATETCRDLHRLLTAIASCTSGLGARTQPGCRAWRRVESSNKQTKRRATSAKKLLGFF